MAILRKLWTDEVEDEEVGSTGDQFKETSRTHLRVGNENLQKVQGKQKAYYYRRAKPCSFKVGDKVSTITPNR